MSKLRAEYNKRLLSIDGVSFFCLFGEKGITEDKIEGDLKTPIGVFKIDKIFYRADKIEKPESPIETVPISKDDGWCDDKNREEYNSLIKLPFDGRFENLWREGDEYDIIITLDYNTSPVIKGKGSAIFIHVAKENMNYTEGCLALKKEDLIKIIDKLESSSTIEISY
ncbi:MAG: L,D-transpeptidase family protein [Candidatus Pacebacteria bacterium]|nr:L,D-transpeptidase family protein [Candidatus Paceibacterota bacterium]